MDGKDPEYDLGDFSEDDQARIRKFQFDEMRGELREFHDRIKSFNRQLLSGSAPMLKALLDNVGTSLPAAWSLLDSGEQAALLQGLRMVPLLVDSHHLTLWISGGSKLADLTYDWLSEADWTAFAAVQPSRPEAPSHSPVKAEDQ